MDELDVLALFLSISSYLNLTLLPEECFFSLRRNAFEKDVFFSKMRT